MRTCLQCGEQTEGLYCPADGMATIVQGLRPTGNPLDVNAVFAGRYRITGVLGRGGMGSVYAAQHTGTGQRVAIKTLLFDAVADLATVRRFFNEARLTAGLQHPNTIRVFDFGQADDGTYFLAMEALQGKTLAEHQTHLLSQGQRMEQPEIVRIAVDILRSLGEAHRVGLVHRDLKPANVFLHEIGDAETIVKVLDFGIAKASDSHLTQTGTSLGTPAYMSPEQVMGGAIDARSDLYSLGVILYGCAAGELPFQAESSFSIMMKHVHEAPPELASLETARVSKDFADVVRRALAKSADDRYPNAAAMREALDQCQHTATVAAPTPVPVPAARPAAPPPARPAVAAAPPPQPPRGRAQSGVAAIPRAAPPPSPVADPPQPAPAAKRVPFAAKPTGSAPASGTPVAVWLGAAALLAVIGAAAAGYFWLHRDGSGEAAVAPVAVGSAAASAPAVAPDAGAAAPTVAAAADAGAAADEGPPPVVVLPAADVPMVAPDATVAEDLAEAADAGVAVDAGLALEPGSADPDATAPDADADEPAPPPEAQVPAPQGNAQEPAVHRPAPVRPRASGDGRPHDAPRPRPGVVAPRPRTSR